jgi:hypothetical protein
MSTYQINLSLTNLSNLSLSLILNQILSHGSYTKDTSQIDVKQPTRSPRMYQTMYLPNTKYHVPKHMCINMYHASKPKLYQTVHQPHKTTVPTYSSMYKPKPQAFIIINKNTKNVCQVQTTSALSASYNMHQGHILSHDQKQSPISNFKQTYNHSFYLCVDQPCNTSLNNTHISYMIFLVR